MLKRSLHSVAHHEVLLPQECNEENCPGIVALQIYQVGELERGSSESQEDSLGGSEECRIASH